MSKDNPLLIVKLNDSRYEFTCSTKEEKWRIETMFTKEPGTISWISEFVPNSIFYDIGANIGIYTIFAHKICKHVYSFEPHVGTCMSLLKNVQTNKANNITPLSIALNDKIGFFNFNYFSNSAGSTNSQLNDITNFTPSTTELKYSTTIDELIKLNIIEKPDYIKIDVDGNELLIVDGMKNLLKENYIKELQIELGPNKDQATKIMNSYGYKLKLEHYTSSGAAKLIKGINQDDIIHNVVYTRI